MILPLRKSWINELKIQECPLDSFYWGRKVTIFFVVKTVKLKNEFKCTVMLIRKFDYLIYLISWTFVLVKALFILLFS